MRAAFAAVLALIAMAFAAPGALAAPFACDGQGYVTQFHGELTPPQTWLQSVDRLPNGDYTLNTLPGGVYEEENINAIGFRVQDGFMYAWNNGLDSTTPEGVTRIGIDASGNPTFEPLGYPVGAPPSFITVVGTFLSDGTYFLWGTVPGVGAVGLIIDVTTLPVPTVIEEVTPGYDNSARVFSDFAVSPVDGKLYASVHTNATGESSVHELVVSGGALLIGARVGPGTHSGAQWFAPDGTFLMYNNSGAGGFPMGIYRTDFATGQMSFVGSAPGTATMDGTACANTISVTKDAEPRTVTAGTELTYSYTITSRALLDSPAQFVDQLPAGMTYVPGGVSVSPAFGTLNDYGGTDTMSVTGTLAPNTTVKITARVRVAPDIGCGVDVNNQAQATISVPSLPVVTVDSDDPDTPADLDDPTAVRVNCSADVEIEKSTAKQVVPGENATYSLKVTNKGPSQATNVVASDPLPKGVSFVSASAGCSEAGGTVTCKLPSLAAGASETFSFTVKVASSAKCSALENTATVTNGVPDPNPGNNSSTVRNCGPRSNLAIAKNASSAKVTAGGQVMYTLVVENKGPSDNDDVEVSDRPAQGLSLQAAKPSQGTCSTAGGRVSCKLGELSAGGSAQVLVTAKVSAASGCVPNSAEVVGNGFDPKQSDNRGDAQICVTHPDPPPARFDLVVAKTSNKKRVLADGSVRYSIVVTNKGPDTAPGVQLTDTFNHRGKIVSVKSTKGSCSKALPIRCSLGDIATGRKARITVVLMPLESGCGQRNAASATGEGTDATPANNLDTVDICVAPRLRVVKEVDRRSIDAGDVVHYTIRVTNLSKRIAAQNVRTCDHMPAGLSLVRSNPKAKLSKGIPCWSAAVIGAGKSKVYRVTAKALRSASGTERNVASVNAAGFKGKALRDAADVVVRGAAAKPTPVTG